MPQSIASEAEVDIGHVDAIVLTNGVQILDDLRTRNFKEWPDERHGRRYWPVLLHSSQPRQPGSTKQSMQNRLNLIISVVACDNPAGANLFGGAGEKVVPGIASR